jgi:nucleoid-associated protein YgaU
MTGTPLIRFAVLTLAAVAAAGAVAFVWSITPERPPAPGQARAPAPSAPTPPPAERQAAIAPDPAPAAAPPAAAPPVAEDDPPAFDIARIEASGEAVIAGRARPGATVELLRDGQVHDRAVADPAGEFVLVPPPLPPGNYDLTLRATRPDGQPVTSRESVAVALAPARKQPPVVALTAPGKPSVVLSKPPAPDPAPAAAVAIEAVETEGGGKLFVSGRTAAGATVRLYLNDSYLAEATASPAGRVAFAIESGMVAGSYRVRLDAVDPASGAVRARAEVPFTVPAVVAAAPPAGPPAPAVAAPPPSAPAAAAEPPAGPPPASPRTASPPPAAAGGQTAAAPSAPARPSEPAPAAGPKPGSPPAAGKASEPPSAARPSVSAAPSPPPAAPPIAAPPPPAAPSAAAPPPAPPQASAPPPAPVATAAPPAAPPGATAPPASAEAPPSLVVIPKIATTTVMRGDNLWRISRTTYGLGVRYSVIYAANQDQIRNPHLIYPGQVFVLPAKAP